MIVQEIVIDSFRMLIHGRLVWLLGLRINRWKENVLQEDLTADTLFAQTRAPQQRLDLQKDMIAVEAVASVRETPSTSSDPIHDPRSQTFLTS